MKTVLMLVITGSLTGCALTNKNSTLEAKLLEVRNLSYAAASMGCSLAIKQNIEWRLKFDTAYDQINLMVESKIMSGALLRQIIESLPVKELKSDEARIIIENVIFLYDTAVGTKVDLEKAPYVLAAATGIRDGFKVALGR